MPQRKTDEEFQREVHEKNGVNYTVIGHYVNTHTKIKIKHEVCGQIFEVTPASFLRYHGTCPCLRSNHLKTNEEFEQQVKDLVGDEYTFLNQYQGSDVKLKVRHNKCGRIYEAVPNSFLRGKNRCTTCYINPRQLTTTQFKQRVYAQTGNEYTVISEYINTSCKIKMKHNRCGCVYEVRPSNFLAGNRCPKCTKRVKLKQKQFEQKVYDLVGNEYTVLGHYINKSTPIKIKHNDCGRIYDIIPYLFLSGTRCRPCALKQAGKKRRLTQKQFEQKVDTVHGYGRYTMLSNYQRSNIKINVKCNVCGNVFSVLPMSLLRGGNCPKCAKKSQIQKQTKTDHQFKREVYQLVGNEYTVIGKYRKAKVKIKILHNRCGHAYEVEPSHFLSGGRCPWCAKHDHMSCGEKLVIKVLAQLGYQKDTDYEYGHILSNKLHLDFWFPDKKLAIEYDGAQHFEKSHFFVSKNLDETPESAFAHQQERDQRKNKYCQEQGIMLIRIPYTIQSESGVLKLISDYL